MAVETTIFSNNSVDTWFRDIMSDCVLCPRACHVNRLAGQTGYCGQTAELMAARASLHYWEEPCISGTSGSGTVFFSGCNLRCVFCQNHNIALGKAGRVIAPEHLAEIFLQLQEQGANNINLVTPTHFLPQIVIAIDEFSDLMMAASKEVEDSVCRLAQMARAAGMHLIIATQRPTTDVITGLIKANIPSRIALSVQSQVDSRTILDTQGAEKLLGYGDMLYYPNGMQKPLRVQGCFCSTKEVETIVDFIKKESVSEYNEEIIEAVEQNMPAEKGDRTAEASEPIGNGDDVLIEKAIDVVVEMGQASTSSLQRKLKLGYARAARIIDELESMGVVGPYEGAKPRKVIMSKQQWAERRARKSMQE